MRIISSTRMACGQRRAGFFHWMDKQNADIVAFRKPRFRHTNWKIRYWPKGYRCYYLTPSRKATVGLVNSRREPDEIVQGLGWPDLDAEGRYPKRDSAPERRFYLPSGSSSEERQAVKFDHEPVSPYLRECAPGRTYILWRLEHAHKPIDPKNWRSNQKNSGFLPEERLAGYRVRAGWLGRCCVVNQEPEQYTGGRIAVAWAKNGLAYRLPGDQPFLRDRILVAYIYKEERFSTMRHSPSTMTTFLA